MSQPQPAHKQNRLQGVIRFVVMIVTALVVPFVANLISPFKDLKPADLMAMVVGLMMAEMGVVMTIRYVTAPTRQLIAKAKPLQLASFFGMAAMLMIPVLAPATADPRLVYAVVVGIYLLQMLANRVVSRAADEMVKRVMTEAAMWGYGAFQVVFIAYAVAERLGLIGSISAWMGLSIMLLIQIAASLWVGIRRGTGQELPDEEPATPLPEGEGGARAEGVGG